MHRAVFVAYALTFAVSYIATAKAEDGPVLRIATEGAFKPWNYTEPNGDLAGFEIDLTHDLCTRMKRTCEIVAQDWDGIIPALNAGKYDAIIAAMSITEERKKAIAFSNPYVGTYHSFLVKQDLAKALGAESKPINLDNDSAEAQSAVKTVADAMSGKVIGVQVASTNEAFTKAFLDGKAQVSSYKTIEQIELDYLAGRVDAILGDLTVLQTESKNPDFAGSVIAGPVFTGGVLGKGVGVGLRKDDNALRDAFNTAIASAAADGTISKLSIKWFGVDIAPM
jgi:octopine/nopaline transport system substrate-binding protein